MSNLQSLFRQRLRIRRSFKRFFKLTQRRFHRTVLPRTRQALPLHGNIVTFSRPLYVIRRVKTQEQTSEDENEEINVSDTETASQNAPRRTLTRRPEMLSTPSKQRTSGIPAYLTPTHKPCPSAPETSSPPVAANQRDYSSDLSSPFFAAKRTRSLRMKKRSRRREA